MKAFKFEITMHVADIWVEDGFGAYCKQDLTRLRDQIEEALRDQLLTSATSSEFRMSVKVISHPDFKQIAELQGYSATSKNEKQ